MSSRLFPLVGILVALAFLGAATSLYQGGFDRRHDYVSTLLRAIPSPARPPAIAGMLVFCASIGTLFERLARAAVSSRSSTVIRIGGVGSMIYSSLTFTPMHDLMVTISLIFLVIGLALLQALHASRQMGFFVVRHWALESVRPPNAAEPR